MKDYIQGAFFLADNKDFVDLMTTFSSQSTTLDSVLEYQKLIRKSVTDKSWTDLENNLFKINQLSETFTQLDSKREKLYRSLCGVAEDAKVPSIHEVLENVPQDKRQLVMDMFHEVRRKLSASKIENDALNDYIRITREFVQGIFDNVIPKNRNTVYSEKGQVVKPMPENLLVDTVM